VDYVLLVVVVILLVVGLIMVFSVTFPPRVQQGSSNPQGDFVKQAMFAVVGIATLIVFARIDYRLWDVAR